METYLYAILILAALSASSFLVLTKWRVINYLLTTGKFGLSNVLECLFCTLFWLGMAWALIAVVCGAPWITLLAPFPAASVARFIID